MLAEVKEFVPSKDAQRMEIRSFVQLASEPISHFWPMQTFIHHNPLHGLEHLPFGSAIEQGRKFLGGKGYLSSKEYRKYYQQGRITQDAIDEALKDQDKKPNHCHWQSKNFPSRSLTHDSHQWGRLHRHPMWLQLL